MRVLYSFPHQLGLPGISTTAFQQVQGLCREGVEVVLYCTSLHRPVDGVSSVVETLRAGRQRVPHRALGVDRAYAYHDRRASRAVNRLARELDVVHVWPAGCLRTLRAARRAGVPSLREAPSEHTASAFENAGREAAALGLELPREHHHRFDSRRLRREETEFAHADRLLVPSAYVEATFLDRGFPPERLVRHRYGYDPQQFPVASVSARRPEGRPFTAVFVGRGEPNKGLHYALRAWLDSGASTDGRFLICGDVLPEYADRLGWLLDHPSVSRLGFVDNVGAVMRDADALVLPSVSEGSALVTYEAQACGCVPVVSEAAGAPVEHLAQGLVHRPGDVRQLTAHLRMLVEDPTLLARLRAGALANAPRLTWREAAARLASIYADVAGAEVPGASNMIAIPCRR